MIPHMYDFVALVRAWLSRSLRGIAPHRHTADTWRAAGVTDLPDVVISANNVLFLAAVWEVVFPSCSRGWAADDEVLSPSCSRGWTANVAVPAVVTAEIAFRAAAAIRETVVTSPRVAGAAAQGAPAADVLAADYGHDHRCGARLSPCLAGLVHGLHLQSRVGLPPAWATANAWDGALLLVCSD